MTYYLVSLDPDFPLFRKGNDLSYVKSTVSAEWLGTFDNGSLYGYVGDTPMYCITYSKAGFIADRYFIGGE